MGRSNRVDIVSSTAGLGRRRGSRPFNYGGKQQRSGVLVHECHSELVGASALTGIVAGGRERDDVAADGWASLDAQAETETMPRKR